MEFNLNKAPVEVIRQGVFGETFIRDIYSGINGKWYKKLWKEFDQLKDIDQKYYCSDYQDLVLINIVLNVEIVKILGK